ncbi:MAG: PAS domain S-box protein [Deltaproteobacteria bacterium]|nr:PAS domain S-box protein [Deltaproteobacteria bacterium]
MSDRTDSGEGPMRQRGPAAPAGSALFTAVFDASPLAINIFNLVDGRSLAVNDAYCRLTGWQRDEVIGHTAADLCLFVDPAQREPWFKILLEGGDVSAQLASIRTKTGEMREVLASLKRVPLADAALAMVIATDVTAQRRLGVDLRLSEERFSKAFQVSPAGMVITDIATGTFLDVNEAFLRMFEYRRDEVVGHTSLELGLLTGGERERLIARQLEVGGLQNTELRARARSGKIVEIMFSSRPLTIEGRACHITTMVDISDRKRVEEELRGSEQRYRRLAENLPDLVWRTDAAGHIDFVNGTVTSLLGYEPEEVRHRPLEDYLAASSVEQVRRWFAASGPGAPVLAELDYLHEQGDVVPGEVHAVPVFDEAGRLVALEGVTRDLRPRRKAEHDKAEVLAQLHQAQRLESVGRLAGGIAHDFNNLLSVILCFAGFAAQQLHEADPVRADVLEIQAAARRAAALTRQLLAFSRRQVLELRVLDVNSIVGGIEKMLGRLIGEHIAVEVRLAQKLGHVLADAGLLEQVLMNLAVNAKDAMPDSGRLVIETREVERAAPPTAGSDGPTARWVAIAVSDTGSGMDEATLRRIFEPFFTTKEKGRGTGLGLSTVYGIVQQCGGFVDVNSELGRGSTFTVYLPRTDAVGPTPAEPEGAVVKGHECVLVVEDDDMVRRLTERILKNAGYHVLAAAGGDEAFRLCEGRKARVDLVVTDVVMPHMSGAELVERLRRMNPALKALFMSGYTDEAVAPHAIQAGPLLTKPFSAADLSAHVRRALDGA